MSTMLNKKPSAKAKALAPVVSTKNPAIVRSFTGIVTAKPDNSTVTVLVKRTVIHPKYGKRYEQSKKYRCQVQTFVPTIGQTVLIQAGRPFSKTKRWLVRSAA